MNTAAATATPAQAQTIARTGTSPQTLGRWTVEYHFAGLRRRITVTAYHKDGALQAARRIAEGTKHRIVARVL